MNGPESIQSYVHKLYKIDAIMNNCRHDNSYLTSNMSYSSTQERNTYEASAIIAKVLAMKRRESNEYLFRNYSNDTSFRISNSDDIEELKSSWRERICHWTYSVIDHFDLSRATAAISIDLFDRYLATQGPSFDDKFALLTSLTTLYIAVKIHEEKKIGLSTLCGLSIFSPKNVEEMELNILQSLKWLVHPPTVVDFTSLLLKFLPAPVPMPIRHQIFDSSRYLGELSVFHPNFIEIPKSTIALAAIINVLESETSMESIPFPYRQMFFRRLREDLGFHRRTSAVRFVCDRLQRMLVECNVNHQNHKAENDDLRPSNLTRSTKVAGATSANFPKTTFTGEVAGAPPLSPDAVASIHS